MGGSFGFSRWIGWRHPDQAARVGEYEQSVRHSRLAPQPSISGKVTEPLPLFARNSRVKIEELRQRHSIPVGFRLAYRLRSIEYAAQAAQVQPSTRPATPDIPTAREQRRFVGRTRTSIRNLHEAIAGASDSELSLLTYGAVVPLRSPSPVMFPLSDLTGLTHILDRLDRTLRNANIPPAHRGRRRQAYRAYIARRLRELYVDVHGERAPRITKGDVYGGRFFAFMEDALPLFGIRRMSNVALGRLCESAIRAADKAQSPKQP